MGFIDWLKSLFAPKEEITIVNPGWEWLKVEVDGDDLLIKDAVATWFGGDHDPQDNGETASGINTKGNPSLMGCALPMIYKGTSTSLLKALGGSPIPKIPWKSPIQVTNLASGKIITIPVIDLGPARSTKHGIDLTQAAFKEIGGDLNRGVLTVDYRVIGGGRGI